MIITEYNLLYGTSRAIIIGINKYANASPLEYAVSDAVALSEIVINKFGFAREEVLVLLDEDATKTRILAEYLKWANHGASSDDRLLFFFAGHGHTFTGRRGEVGYLVPYDGNTEDLSSLIRWDDLTRNAELFKSKHMLFLMDACYGGLALTRAPSPGSMRFLKDMLLRFSRQVLTAGKANEVVADSGGPVPEHSIFTGHLIEALHGKAATKDGVITANGVMAYVYEKVCTDENSRQTPHYGYLDGDGDFIFEAPGLSELVKEDKTDSDLLLSMPTPGASDNPEVTRGITDLAKEYLSEARHKIRLHDLVATEARRAMSMTSEDNFPVQGASFSKDEFLQRVNRYEESIATLAELIAMTSYWGTDEHVSIIKMSIGRMLDRLDVKGGLVIWLNLRLYPILLLTYYAGISAIASENYKFLYSIMMLNANNQRTDKSSELVLVLGRAIADLHDAFKTVPGHENNYTPRSEYMFKLLQPKLDDLLFLGGDYEAAFDKFEVFLALVYVDLSADDRQFVWGPIGRFGWKYRNGRSTNPFAMILDEAGKMQDKWPPLTAGFFGGDYKRFEAAATSFKDLLAKLNWY